MENSNLTQKLRSAGLRPSFVRVLVLRLMKESGLEPQCCSDVYLSAVRSGQSINVSSIAHALSDLERAGCLERARIDGRKILFRCTAFMLDPAPAMLVLEHDGQRRQMEDPALAERLSRMLIQLDIPLDERDALVLRVERPAST